MWGNMKKQEFLVELQKALSSRVSVSSMQENVRYYDDYISMQMRKGRTEEEIIEEIGDPRLIAKSIITAEMDAAQTETEEKSKKHKKGNFMQDGRIQLPLWLICILVALGVFLAVYLIGAVLMWALPILLPMLLIIALIRYFRRR